MTSHAAQGQKFKKGAIVDLCIGKGANPLGSYVAMTRVTHRRHLLIYRPFPRELFAKGEKEGPELLLKQLRGELTKQDWERIEEEHMPRARCVGCNHVQFKGAFQPQQWNRKDHLRFCRQCIGRYEKVGTPHRCNTCGLWKETTAFPAEYWHAQSLTTRVCTTCEETRACTACKFAKSSKHFSVGEWEHARWQSTRQGRCKDCAGRYTEEKTCAGGCERVLPLSAFSGKKIFMQNDSNRICAECMKEKEGKTKKCAGPCQRELPLSGYSGQKMFTQKDSNRICVECKKDKKEKTKKCSGPCQRELPLSGYSGSKMFFQRDDTRKCLECMGKKKKQGWWTCVEVECKRDKPTADFSQWLATRAHKKNDGTARCNPCFQAQNETRKRSIRDAAASVTKR